VPGEWIVITSHSATKTAQIASDPDCPPAKIHLRLDRQTGKLETWTESSCYLPTRRPIIVLADGTLIDNHPNGKNRNRSWRNADGSLTRVTEELKRNGAWKPMAYGTRISREMTPQFLAQLRGSAGDSGLMGALAMATGAALAGGNAEQVMGMAMKGAELTTDNEMSRNVLAGQGDAMVAAGTQRMVAENGSGAAANSAPPSSAGIGGQPGPAMGSTANSETTYYDCFGVVKKRTSAGDVTDTIYYGLVTSSRADPEGARNLFRQHTGSDAASDTENAGVGCHPYKTRAEAQTHNNAKIARDAKGKWRQVTGIDLSL
jgi:hypothetical protein